MPEYTVTLRFNSRLRGSRQIWTGTIQADSPQNAIDRATGQQLRDPTHGQSLYLTGASVDELP